MGLGCNQPGDRIIRSGPKDATAGVWHGTQETSGCTIGEGCLAEAFWSGQQPSMVQAIAASRRLKGFFCLWRGLKIKPVTGM
jgi:hypothetical protein